MPTDGTVSYKTNEGVYDIPVEKQQDFLKQNPHAEEVKSFIQGKDTFDIPINKVNDFTKQYPDAQPLKKKRVCCPCCGKPYCSFWIWGAFRISSKVREWAAQKARPFDLRKPDSGE